MKKLSAVVLLLGALSMSAASAQDRYRPIDVTNWKPKKADHPFQLVEQLYGGFPESLEGKPKLKMDLSKSPDGESLLLKLEITGYLDDFIEGERYRATVVKDGDKWKLKALDKQWKCYRGSNKGWHLQQCP